LEGGQAEAEKKPRIRIRVKEPRAQPADNSADNLGRGGRENGAGEQVAPPRASFLRGVSPDITGRGRENSAIEQEAPPSGGFLRPAVPTAGLSNEIGSNNSDDLEENGSFQGPTRSAVARLLEHNTHADDAEKVEIGFGVHFVGFDYVSLFLHTYKPFHKTPCALLIYSISSRCSTFSFNNTMYFTFQWFRYLVP